MFCQTCLAPPCQVVCIRCVTMCTSERSLTSTCEATGLGDFALVAARLGRGAGHATHPITCKPSDVILFAVTCLCFVQYVFVTFSASSVCVSVCTMVGRTSSASPTMRVPRGTRGMHVALGTSDDLGCCVFAAVVALHYTCGWALISKCY